LVREGCHVICLDNFFTGARSNVAELVGDDHFEIVRHDVEQPFTMEVDEIYHLACPASPIHYQRNPVRTLRTAVMGTANVLDVAREARARILIASTSEVYGDPLQHPQSESYWGNVNPIGPRACYDEGKRCAEAMALSFTRQYGTDVRIARIFNTYGPRLHHADGRVVSNFIVQALRSQPLTIYGDGSQTRSFCFVSDLTDGLMRLMASEHQGPVNLGNPVETTMLQLARLIQELTRSPSEPVFAPLPTDDPVRRKPDIACARRLLDWEPRVSLREGLSMTVDYFRQLAGQANQPRETAWRAVAAMAR
jgi:UDP-glucuronate decarboxylase